ncbi:hypothetical protein THAOC_26755 [Thalassiosira oceanica]|uniref:Uncharacterized protein n=1 Tax=Thalassiosira oceanica TaxID=159749 RepID=K0RY43_THAOC|nr:hypothetical protein THAOC_26755 [Thalassiosira oceanica]|eukprot:EJK53741.1 hypothetical protein THAOC_26755 [Thalassiosira oceanica]
MDDVDGVGSQQPPAVIPYRRLPRKILRSRASLIGRQKNINGSEWMIVVAWKWEDEEVQDMSDRKWDVERPMPILSADVDSEVLTGMHVNEEEEAKWNIEGLVRARYESGVLARRLSSGGGSIERRRLGVGGNDDSVLKAPIPQRARDQGPM